MILKGVVEARSFADAEFPKPKPGQPPAQVFTYIDEHTSRDPQMVTVPIDNGIPTDQRPEKGEVCTVVFLAEQVERVVTRTDREDASRTYNAATKQFKLKAIAFERGEVAAKRAKAAA